VLLQLLATVTLSRLLSPTDFGLFALVMSIVALGELLRDFGLTTASSRVSNLTPRVTSTLFYLNSVLGLTLGLAAFLLAPVIADMFGQPELDLLVRLLSVTFFVNGVSAQFRAEINRQLRFARLTIVDTVPVAIGLAVGIGWAVMSPGPVALAAQQITTACAGLTLAAILAGWWPGRPAPLREVRSLLSFGANLFGTQLLAYGAKNIDNFALASTWGPQVLGVYSRAYQLLMMPINQLSAPLTRVTVPLMSRAHEEHGRIDHHLLRAQTLSVLTLVGGYCFLLGAATYLVPVIFGPGWSAMVPVFQLLAIGGVFRALNQVLFWGFLASDRTGSQLGLYTLTQPLIILAILAGLPWGAAGVAAGHSAGYGIAWIIGIFWYSRRPRAAGVIGLHALWTSALVGAVTCLTALVWSYVDLSDFARLLCAVISYGIALAILLLAIRPFRVVALSVLRALAPRVGPRRAPAQ
jgi:PST family polysaccharide transporter